MLDSLSIDALEVLRWVVFGLFIIAAAGVTLGVYWENEDFEKAIRHRGWKLLVWSLGAEILLTIGVFAIDGTIASKQRTTITQLLAHRTLGQDQKDRLISVAKKFPSLNFQTVTVLENEPWGFVTEIGSFLESQGWNWIRCGGGGIGGPLPALPPAQGKPTSCWTIVEGIQINGANAAVVGSLVDALKDSNVVGMDNVRPVISEAYPTVVIMVGTKL